MYFLLASTFSMPLERYVSFLYHCLYTYPILSILLYVNLCCLKGDSINKIFLRQARKTTRTIDDILSAVRDLRASENLRSEHLNYALWGEVCKHLGITNRKIHRKRAKKAYIQHKQVIIVSVIHML